MVVLTCRQWSSDDIAFDDDDDSFPNKIYSLKDDIKLLTMLVRLCAHLSIHSPINPHLFKFFSFPFIPSPPAMSSTRSIYCHMSSRFFLYTLSLSLSLSHTLNISFLSYFLVLFYIYFPKFFTIILCFPFSSLSSPFSLFVFLVTCLILSF
ncbi:unnamed protein product [Acanthosepion pharaonis]|uniref:Uncharacterized protein n=1 Tax=Acanthosepion pharaonis TaxID=158019 RepID=A0A812BJQ3_ACAPH|nr:unnamed protein product [Sepia pharaonis]